MEDVSPKARGGYARAEILTPSKRSEIAKQAALSRWNDVLPSATHQGTLQIGEMEIDCAVLDTGQRVITQSGFMRALGRARQAKGRAYYDGDVNMPAFLTAKNLKQFISKDLEVTSSQIEFRLKGRRAFGYPAELLPKVCDVFLDAADAHVLTPQQEHIAAKAQMLIRGLARVGIVALVDEATGYQDVRPRDELRQILEAYIAKELLPWTRRFPPEFYQEMFRLRGWSYDPVSVKRPILVGKLTENVVYKRLPPGVLEELKQKNPKNERGRRKHKHFQFLTDDIGHPHLEKHISSTVTLMRISSTWDQFKKFLNKAFPIPTAEPELPGLEEPDTDRG